MEALTPGHFIIGLPTEALTDPNLFHQPMPASKRWHLCQTLVRHFWQQWSLEYLGQLQRFFKWNPPSRNVQVDGIVCLREEQIVPVKWPLARVMAVNPGAYGKVRVVTVQTQKRNYECPFTKIVTLIHESYTLHYSIVLSLKSRSARPAECWDNLKILTDIDTSMDSWTYNSYVLT